MAHCSGRIGLKVCMHAASTWPCDSLPWVLIHWFFFSWSVSWRMHFLHGQMVFRLLRHCDCCMQWRAQKMVWIRHCNFFWPPLEFWENILANMGMVSLHFCTHNWLNDWITETQTQLLRWANYPCWCIKLLILAQSEYPLQPLSTTTRGT